MRRGSTLNDFMQWDDTLFDGITLHPDINHGLLVSTIMFQCGLQMVLYQDYDVYKAHVHNWFAIHEWNFNRLAELIKKEYEPLWNKDVQDTTTERVTFDGTENETTDTQKANTGTIGDVKNGNETLSGTDTVSNTYNTQTQNTYNTQVQDTYNSKVAGTDSKTTQDNRSNNNIHSVKGFNATGWQETDKDEFTENRSVSENGTNQSNKTGTDTESKTGTDTETKTGTDQSQTQYGKGTTVSETLTKTLNTVEDTDANRNRAEQNVTEKELELWSRGNQGVTTTQAMFLEEVDLLGGFNLYQFIARKFDNDLMMGVYI